MNINILLYGILTVGVETLVYYMFLCRTCGLHYQDHQYEKTAGIVHVILLEFLFIITVVFKQGVFYVTFLLPCFLLLPGFLIVQRLFTISLFRNLFLSLLWLAQSMIIRAAMVYVLGVYPFQADVYLIANRFGVIPYLEGLFLLDVCLLFSVMPVGNRRYGKRIYSIREKAMLSGMMVILIMEIIYFGHQERERLFWLSLAILQGCVLLFVSVENDIMQNHKNREQELFQFSIRNQISYYESIEKNQQEVYRLYHDIKNHFLTLKAMEDGQSKYICQCMEKVNATEGQVESGIAYVDVLLNDKWRRAQEKNIDMIFSMQRDALEGIEIFDLTVLLGNTLDNALEAAEKVMGRKAVVTVKTGKRGNCIFIHIANDYEEAPVQVDGDFQTVKKDRKYHGIGLKNVRETVKKYGGELKTEFDGTKFYVAILLYVRMK